MRNLDSTTLDSISVSDLSTIKGGWCRRIGPGMMVCDDGPFGDWDRPYFSFRFGGRRRWRDWW